MYILGLSSFLIEIINSKIFIEFKFRKSPNIDKSAIYTYPCNLNSLTSHIEIKQLITSYFFNQVL